MAGKLKDYLNWIKIQLILIYYSRHYNTIYTIYIFAELVRIHLREGGGAGTTILERGGAAKGCKRD